MAAATPSTDTFKDLFPQFATTGDGAIEAWFVQAALRFTAARFGAGWPMAVYLFTAHQLTTFAPAGVGVDSSGDHVARGAVSSEKVGDLQTSYTSQVDLGSVPKSLHWLTGTTYGQQLIGIIMSRSAARGRVVRTGSSR